MHECDCLLYGFSVTRYEEHFFWSCRRAVQPSQQFSHLPYSSCESSIVSFIALVVAQILVVKGASRSLVLAAALVKIFHSRSEIGDHRDFGSNLFAGATSLEVE